VPYDWGMAPGDDDGYQRLPGSLQWPARSQPLDTASWVPCPGCARPIPVARVFDFDAQAYLDGFTAVCPYCKHVTIGPPNQKSTDWTGQRSCHDCGTPLEGGARCARCGMPRAWMTVSCPSCGNAQATELPHWVRHCDLFFLQCVACMRGSTSLCIC